MVVSRQLQDNSNPLVQLGVMFPKDINLSKYTIIIADIYMDHPFWVNRNAWPGFRLEISKETQGIIKYIYYTTSTRELFCLFEI